MSSSFKSFKFVHFSLFAHYYFQEAPYHFSPGYFMTVFAWSTPYLCRGHFSRVWIWSHSCPSCTPSLGPLPSKTQSNLLNVSYKTLHHLGPSHLSSLIFYCSVNFSLGVQFPKHRHTLRFACYLTGMILFSHLGYPLASFMDELRRQFFEDAFPDHPKLG